jgi:hypothetical protein
MMEEQIVVRRLLLPLLPQQLQQQELVLIQFDALMLCSPIILCKTPSSCTPSSPGSGACCSRLHVTCPPVTRGAWC